MGETPTPHIHLAKHCTCGRVWPSIENFLDDPEVTALGAIDDPEPAYALSGFAHACGDTLFVRRVDVLDSLAPVVTPPTPNVAHQAA